MKKLLSALAFLLISGPGHSAEPGVTGTFSSLHFGTEDLVGVEISVVVGGNGHYVIVQCAEGAPGIPEVAVAHLQGTELSFQLSADSRSGCPAAQFRGIISSTGLTGTFEGSSWPGFLKRGRSYWQ